MKIFIHRNIPESGLKLLKEAGYEIIMGDSGRSLVDCLSEVNAMLCHFSVAIDKDIITEVKKRNPHFKVIANFAVGFNNIDINACKELGVIVTNTPDVLSVATAELGASLILAVARRHQETSLQVKNGQWITGASQLMGQELRGKTLGIFGAGRIAFELAKMMKFGFGMEIIYCKRSPSENFDQILKAKQVSLEELLSTSNIISLHAPLTEETKGLFDYQKLKLAKKDSIFINTARGGLVVESDLIKVLKEGHFFGVGLDVTEVEPLSTKSELLNFPRVLVLPHIGSATTETREEMSSLAAKNIIQVLKGEKALTPVN